MKRISKAKLTGSVVIKKNPESIYNIAINGLNGQPILLSAFKGKKLLFVNVASSCGFTKQYKELQDLSDKYADKLVVIGVPCNQFGSQEKGNASEIQEFCELNFGVTFLLTEKVAVKGNYQHPLYKWLTSEAENGVKSSNVKWNFQKYLVDDTGHFIDYYYSTTTPMSSRITMHL
ncbi:glutathione peroxidase [Tenacibaculum salmonis]|uniref:glutathione peroxidase n=1 Tax=Tenacibaculum sp. P3-BQ1 TaxID=3232310 RepID=UPI0034DF8214